LPSRSDAKIKPLLLYARASSIVLTGIIFLTSAAIAAQIALVALKISITTITFPLGLENANSVGLKTTSTLFLSSIMINFTIY
jgi:hypothetical protein